MGRKFTATAADLTVVSVSRDLSVSFWALAVSVEELKYESLDPCLGAFRLSRTTIERTLGQHSRCDVFYPRAGRGCSRVC